MEPDSISNRKLTLLRKLGRKKYRWQEQLFMVEGARAVEQILQNGELQVKELFFDAAQRYWQQPPWQQAASEYPASVVGEAAYAEVSDTETPQGVLALCHMPPEPAPEALAAGEGLVVATDAIQDPGNLGTIIRTAGWFGAAGLISGKGTVDIYHPKVVRSTAGSSGAVPALNADLEEVLPVFEQEGWQVLMLDAAGDARELKSVDRTARLVLVVGNEANGIAPDLFKPGRQRIRIGPPAGRPQVESLNAAIATSIALYALT